MNQAVSSESAVPEGEILVTARELVVQLESGNGPEVSRLLGELSRVRESDVFREMGKITRQLHDALKGFQIETHLVNITAQEIPEAKERLSYVVSMTEQAANQTLSVVEQTLPVSDNLRQRAAELAQRWQRFTRREMQPAEFRSLNREVQEFFGTVVSDSDRIHTGLSDVLMAQGFQDLTGQVLKRVISLVQDVEESLVNIIRVSAEGLEELRAVPAGVEPPKLEGPQISPQKRSDVVSGQDEVDDLLSSLGF